MSRTSRDLGADVREGLTIMRDADDDENSWVLPDLRVIARALAALSALVDRGEDRHRYGIALHRIANEWNDRNGYDREDIQEYAAAVIRGESARRPMGRLEPVNASSPTAEAAK